ncbi:hypothetical protein [Streptomyces sp. NPDC021096]|uniref:hypothetical protein n=1 Tax=Streptomyces sp. NPDC021096 TaxID=3154792 RepID=UPI00340AF06C
MPSAAPPAGDPGKYPINATAVDLTWNGDDQNVWFVTAEGIIGVFEPRSPWSSSLFTPGSGVTGNASSIVAWPGHGVWTFITGQEDGAFVNCGLNGLYRTYPLSGRMECRSLALAQGPGGHACLVAALTDWKMLAFVAPGGAISYSRGYPAGLYAVAAAQQDPALLWISSPGGRSLATYDVRTGEFSQPISIGAEARDIAVTPTGDAVWAATPDNVLFKYTAQGGMVHRVETQFPAHRLTATADGTLWFAGTEGNAIGYVLPGQTRAATIPMGEGNRPSGVTVSGDSQLWVALSGEKALQRVSRYRLAVESGDGQSAVAGQRFAEPLVVKATQLDGTPVGGQRIEFRVEAGSAVFENGEPVEIRHTEADGVAPSSLLKALKEGPCVVTARWAETEAVASFSRLTVTPPVGAAHHVRYVSGAGQTVSPGKSFDEPMKVVVEDENGIPVPGAEVTFKIRDEGAATFPGGVDTAKVTSEADGSAMSPVLTAGDKADVFAVRVWVAKTPVSLLLDQNIQ